MVGQQLWRGESRRRVGAHAAGIWPLVVVVGALVVAGGRQRRDALAIGQREEREFDALHELLDQHARPRRAERALQHQRIQRVARLALVVADEDALASGQPIGLHHDRECAAIRRAPHAPTRSLRSWSLKRTAAAVGTPARSISDLAQSFAALDARRRRRWSKDRQATRREDIHDAAAERVFWPNHRQVNRMALGPVGARGEVHRVEGEVFGDGRCAAVAGRAVELAELRRAAERPAERVFARP